MANTPGISASAVGTGSDSRSPQPPKRIGLVVHPSRNVDRPLQLLREWTQSRGVDVVQAPAAYSQRRVTAEGDPADADLIVSIGGDGTTLAALRTGAAAGRPVLGVACGSLGALATVSAGDVARALDRFSRDEWRPRRFPALSIARPEGDPLWALNDVAVVRAGGGQVRMIATVDGTLFARLAGDGAVVSTPAGSSGYTISAGGPLLASGLDAFVFTPLPNHGGFAPPLVLGPATELQLDIEAGYAGARLEVDGQMAEERVRSLNIGLRKDVATMVSFEGEEPLFAGLRRRRIILDSARMMAEAGDGPAGCP